MQLALPHFHSIKTQIGHGHVISMDNQYLPYSLEAYFYDDFLVEMKLSLFVLSV